MPEKAGIDDELMNKAYSKFQNSHKGSMLMVSMLDFSLLNVLFKKDRHLNIKQHTPFR